MFAGEIRRRRVEALRSSRWKWHLDEMYVKINGKTHYLWRAVDHEGEVLESVVTKKRDREAALKLLRKLLRRHGKPDQIVTDKLRSYEAPMRDLGLDKVRHETNGRWINNRTENSHLPFRRRERAMLRFRRMQSLQKFAAVHGSVHNHPPGQARGYASTRNAISTADRTSRKIAPLLLPSGVSFLRPEETRTWRSETGSSLSDTKSYPPMTAPPGQICLDFNTEPV